MPTWQHACLKHLHLFHFAHKKQNEQAHDLHHWNGLPERRHGKSTLARLFARELANDGFSVKIADLDTQQTTCTDWAADRAEARIEPEKFQVQALASWIRHLRKHRDTTPTSSMAARTRRIRRCRSAALPIWS